MTHSAILAGDIIFGHEITRMKTLRHHARRAPWKGAWRLSSAFAAVPWSSSLLTIGAALVLLLLVTSLVTRLLRRCRWRLPVAARRTWPRSEVGDGQHCFFARAGDWERRRWRWGEECSFLSFVFANGERGEDNEVGKSARLRGV